MPPHTKPKLKIHIAQQTSVIAKISFGIQVSAGIVLALVFFAALFNVAGVIDIESDHIDSDALLGEEVITSDPAVVPSTLTGHPRIFLTPEQLAALQTDPDIQSSIQYQTGTTFFEENTLYGPSWPTPTPGTFLGDGSRAYTTVTWLTVAIMNHLLDTEDAVTYTQAMDDIVQAWVDAPGYDELWADADNTAFRDENKWWRDHDYNYTGSGLISLSLAYDWAYDHWTQEERNAILAKIVTELQGHFAVWSNTNEWPGYTLNQNHSIAAYGAIIIASVAAEDSPDYDPAWRAFAYQQLEILCQVNPVDGSFHEGAGGYSRNMLDGMTAIAYLRATIDGTLTSCPFLEAYPDFHMANSLPGNRDQVNPGHNGTAGQPLRDNGTRWVRSSSFHMIDLLYGSPKAAYIAELGPDTYTPIDWYPYVPLAGSKSFSRTTILHESPTCSGVLYICQ